MKKKDSLDNLDIEKCPKCGNKFFNPLVKVYSLAADKSASNKKQFFSFQVFSCSNSNCDYYIDPSAEIMGEVNND